MLQHPPYSPDLAPADFFLFPKVKNQLAGISMDKDEVKKVWEGVINRMGADEWLAVFTSWRDRIEKCIQVAGNFVEK